MRKNTSTNELFTGSSDPTGDGLAEADRELCRQRNGEEEAGRPLRLYSKSTSAKSHRALCFSRILETSGIRLTGEHGRVALCFWSSLLDAGEGSD